MEGALGNTHSHLLMPNFHNKSLVARNVGLTLATRVVTYLTPDMEVIEELGMLLSPYSCRNDSFKLNRTPAVSALTANQGPVCA